MTRHLHSVKKERSASPTFSLMKKAIRLYRSKDVSRATYKANARKWVRSMLALGDRHILKGKAPAKWGQAGDGKGIGQVFAPRTAARGRA